MNIDRTYKRFSLPTSIKIQLDKNRFEQIDRFTFNDLLELRSVYLDYSEIISLPSDLFEKYMNLKIIV